MQSPHAWRGVWQRPHHLATRFARRGHFVRYVEPRYLRRLFESPSAFLASRAEDPAPNLEVRPATLVNGERVGAIRNWNLRSLARELRGRGPTAWHRRPARASISGASSTNANPPQDPGGMPGLRPPSASEPVVLWLYNPHEAALARMLPADLVVYDIMDEYSAFPWAPPRVAEEERELLRAADLVFAGTAALFDAKRPLARGPVELELSGVEAEHFARESASSTTPSRPSPSPEVAREIAGLRARYRRLVGYAGVIDVRIDRELIAAEARRRPDVGWSLLGPTVGDFPRDAFPPNVHFAGRRDYAELPFHFHSWDAALLPFVENDLTRHVNPTKMLEYAAAGLPVVARALPDVERFYSEGALLYRSAEEFARALDRVVPPAVQPGEEEHDAEKAPPDADVARRVELARGWARDRSWDAIADRMLARVEAMLGERRAGAGQVT